MIEKIINTDKIKSSLVVTAGYLWRTTKSPDEVLGELFSDVQKQQIYSDGKTFVDLIPKHRMKQVQQEYLLAKQDPQFDLREFVGRHFSELPSAHSKEAFVSDPTMTVSDHIAALWRHLERRNRRDRGSLIALPYAYIVPGGRFNEQFYWDSYFIMLGLAAENRWDMIEGMVKNYTYLMRKFGFIPTANRTYLLSRSQPPFFSHMVRLLVRHKGKLVLVEYLPYLLTEYRFWMKGRTKLAKQEHRAFARVVQMKNGELLNLYYQNKITPRPESLHEYIETAGLAIERDAERLYLHLRAGAESGWDFSSRWFSDVNDIRTIHTADIIPVDLNSLLYQLESTIAEAYQVMKQPLLVRKFQKLADRRAAAINKHCWDEEAGFYVDYNFHQEHTTGRLSLAGVFPLYAKIASTKQAAAVADVIQRDFLKDGGLVTTLVENSQQWDAPNGWAPLHWIVIEGLRNYGYYTLANDIKHRWIATNMKVYQSQHKLVEKYNVVTGDGLGGGGEYPLQDGFGWTNGVLAALLTEDEPKQV
jgi:alpha,alpha-trehalase